MRLPEFNAEISLQIRGQGYRNVRGSRTANGNSAILPQLRRLPIDPVRFCESWCLLNGGSQLQCFFFCDPVTAGTISI
jgi:hypothetical protein